MDTKDTEKIENFSDMVTATQKLTKPWMIFCGFLLAALVITNGIWGYVHWRQIQYAYMTPEEFTQEQLFDEQSQNQSHTSGVTDGE